MKKLNFRSEEVISFLESLILKDSANENEILLYEDYHWDGFEYIMKLDELRCTYMRLVRKMKKEYFIK